jgi:nucleotide-binding universal stress UspA family protein
MSAYERAVVGVDGYDGGRDAIALARVLRVGRLRLAGVYLGGRAARSGALRDWDEMLRSETERMLEAARLEAGIEAEIEAVADTSPARALHRLAERDAADLIVVGSSHRGALGRVLAGDVARAVLYDAPCAVAVAPRRYRNRAAPPQRIGVAFDDSPEAHGALDHAARLAAEGGRLALYSVTPEPWEHPAVAGMIIDWEEVLSEEHANAQARGEAALADLGLEGDVHVIRGDADALVDATAGCDVMFAGSRGYGPLKRVVLGSTSGRLVRDAACPVVVVPRPANA